MIAAAGFSTVLQATGDVKELVFWLASVIGSNKLLAALGMILIGLLITMGIGSSFSTVPIIASIYIPLCMTLEFSTLATICITAAATITGDAGSPVSDTMLGMTSGLNADGQHDHIWDTTIPAFIHFNIPLVAFGLIGAMVL
jgi:predicted histidine transporter YuiF (NhaC family)